MNVRKFSGLLGRPSGERIFEGDPNQAPRPREFLITGGSVELAMTNAGVEVDLPIRAPEQTSAESLVERIVRDGYIRELGQHVRGNRSPKAA